MLGVATLLSLPLASPQMVKAETDAQGFERVQPDQLDWKPVPGGHGLMIAIVSGDPSKPGIYVVRAKFPPGVMSTPHFHGEERYVTVIKGTWYTGTDAHWDPATTVGMPVGAFMKHPAGAVHFDGAKDQEAIVQIIGIGPSSTTPIYKDMDPAGNPHKLN
jgi:hypothetical protein